MTHDPQKKPPEGEPIPGPPSDSGATMKAAPNGSDSDPRRLSIEDLSDPHRAEEALTHWDELDPALLTAIASHPQHGPRLAMLRRADRWLERKARAMRPAGACPSSEELYDFGRGPGFGPLESARRAEIERHLRSCRDCENLVETLAALPPVPIATGSEAGARDVAGLRDSDGMRGSDGSREVARRTAGRSAERDDTAIRDAAAGRDAAEVRDTEIRDAAAFRNAAEVEETVQRYGIRPSNERGVREPSQDGSEWTISAPPARRRLRALPKLLPVAAAASLVLGLGLWIAYSSSGSESVRFPTAPLLRGSSGGPLFFPRDRALHVTPEVRAAFPALDGMLVFEIEAQADATSYRIDVARHGGDVFAADEGSVMKLTGAAPSGSTPSGTTLAGSTPEAAPVSIRATTELGPGQYTWSARATVHGLDHELGQRDFSVVDDAELSGRLVALAPQAEPKRSLAAVKLLHEAGFLGEARAIARAMPASPERDAYLSQVPGR
jgi:hypothetical protein